MLEGPKDDGKKEAAVQLDLSNVPKYSIFPGQVVAAEGLNVNGAKLVAKEIYCDAKPDAPPPLKLVRGINLCFPECSGLKLWYLNDA